MPSAAVSVLTAAVAWAAAAVALAWPGLPGRWRHALALVTSAVGLITLVVALREQGQREALTTGQFLLGGAYVTGHASASASLRYYVVTAVCLLLGTAGLALPDQAARRLDRHWLANAVGLSLGVTALRFALEKVAAPMTWTRAVGITWLAPVIGALFLLRLREQGRGIKALLASLTVYALASRGAVALLMVAASALRVGSHYDLGAVTWVRVGDQIYHFVPRSVHQVLILGVLPQLTFWVCYTVAAGLAGAALMAAFLWVRRGNRVGVLPQAAAAGPEA